MRIETRKLHLIDEILKVKSEATLSALENLLKRSAKDTTAKSIPSLKEFSGKWPKDEAEIEHILLSPVKQSIPTTGRKTDSGKRYLVSGGCQTIRS